MSTIYDPRLPAGQGQWGASPPAGWPGPGGPPGPGSPPGDGGGGEGPGGHVRHPRRRRFLAAGAVAIAGLPPLNGFVSEWLLLQAFLIVIFTYFYTAVQFNPIDQADNLRKYGGYIPGIRPGQKTSEYIDAVLTRITVVGAAYVTVVCLLPQYLISELSVPFYFGGTSLLIVVVVTMDTMSQVQAHLLSHQYEGLMKQARLKTGR